MSKSIKINFGYNLILTFCNYLFPLITYPYVSRVLGVEKIGMCNFVDGIINYFVLFSILGIGSYGVREIAKCRDDIAKRNYVFSNLIVLNFIGTFVAATILVCCTLWLPSFQPYRDFLWIGLMKLLLNMFLIEWFFQGLQEFRYITIRSVIVRCIYVICVFLFIHSQEDAIIYYILTSGTVILNAIFNWTYSHKFRSLDFRNLKLGRFIIPVLTFGYYRILTSMYTSFNVVFLGFTSGDAEVGYFTTATKLYTIIMGVFTAFTTVMVPKVSELLASGEKARLQKIANQTFSLLTSFAFPMIIYSLFCANDIILLLSGAGYEGAYTPFRIVIFLLIIIGLEQIIIQQFLMASNSNKSILSVSTTGAIVGILMNILLTPIWGAIGSAISWGASELSVLAVGVVLMKKHVGIELQFRKVINSLLWSLCYILPLMIIWSMHLSTWYNLIASGISTLIIFLVINLVFDKNEFIYDSFKKVLKRG